MCYILGYCARQELKLQYEKLDLLLFINLGKKIFFSAVANGRNKSFFLIPTGILFHSLAL